MWSRRARTKTSHALGLVPRFCASGSVTRGGFERSSRRRHTRSLCDWSSDVCSSDLGGFGIVGGLAEVIGLVATTADAMYRRRQFRAAIAPAFAALCFLGTLLSYFFGNRPVNTKIEQWTPATLPVDWSSYRDTWEIAHAVSAILSVLAMVALVVATIWPPAAEKDMIAPRQ